MSDSTTRLISLIRKEFIQIARDPRTLILAIWIPIMQLLLLGYSATTDVRNVPLAVLDQDRSPASRRLLEAFQAADYFVLSLDAGSLAELRASLDDGTARVGLIIPPDYSRRLNAGDTAAIAIVLDGSDPSVGATALNAAQLIASDHSTRIMEARLNRMGAQTMLSPPIESHTQVWYNPDMVSAYFMVPGVIAQILFTLTSVLTASAVVRERERGTIEQLIVTPIRPWELIVGKTVPYVLLAFLNTLEVLALGSFIFEVPIRGELSLILLLSGLFLLTGLGIGLLASTVANTQQEAMMIVYMTMLPTIFLSGFFFPLEAMPKILQWISYAVPMRYYLVIIRSLMIKGVTIDALTDEILALVAFAGVILGLAVLRFRKRLD